MKDEKLREQITEALPCFRDIFDKMPCPYDGECSKCGDIREAVDHLVVVIKEAGYLPREEAEKQYEIGHADGQAAGYLDGFKEGKETTEARYVPEAKGQLYRRKE